MARVVEIIDAAVFQQEAAHEEYLFGRIRDEAAEDDRWNGTSALLAKQRCHLMSADSA